MSNKLLLIENCIEWVDRVKDVLPLTFNFAVESKSIREFQKEASEGTIPYDDYSCCFIDLELREDGEDLNDTDGKSIVLSKLKEKAFWMPAVCFTAKDTSFLEKMHHISLSDFDCFLWKYSLLRLKIHQTDLYELSPSFHFPSLGDFLDMVTIKRNSSLIGVPFNELNARVSQATTSNTNETFVLDDDLKRTINALECFEIQDYIKALSLLGLHDEKAKIISTTIPGGRSGEFANKFTIQDCTGGITSWFVKWGKNKTKLQREIRMFTEILKSNIEKSILAKPLFNNLVLWKNYGFITYNFFDDAISCNDYIKQHDLDLFFSVVNQTLKQFYIKKPPSLTLFQYVVEKYLRKEYNSIEWPSKYKGEKNISLTYIHGDLHLGNLIFTQEKFVLIDFEKMTKDGPIALDLAKLSLDILLKFDFEFLKESQSLSFIILKQSKLGKLFNFIESDLLTSKDDLDLFNVFLICYAKRFLDYDGISNEKKEVLKRLIKETCNP